MTAQSTEPIQTQQVQMPARPTAAMLRKPLKKKQDNHDTRSPNGVQPDGKLPGKPTAALLRGKR